MLEKNYRDGKWEVWREACGARLGSEAAVIFCRDSHTDGFLGGSVVTSGPTCQCRRRGFYPWCGKTPQAFEQPGPCATTIEPVLQSPPTTGTEACEPGSLCSATREASTGRSLRAMTREWSRLLQLEKSPSSNQDPAQSINKENLKKKDSYTGTSLAVHCKRHTFDP